MKSVILLFAPVLLLLRLSVVGQEKWDLKKDKDGIKVYTRKSAFLKFDEIKVETVLDGSISQLAAVLMDVNDHPQWAYKTMGTRMLKTASAADIYYYTQVECPWPFANRDLAVHMTISQNPVTKVTTMEMRNADGVMPEQKGFVRIKYSAVTWVVSPIGNKQVKVDYQIQVDPSGSLPAWLLNMFITKGPYESFMKLKERVVLPQYAGAKFGFIVD